MWGQSDNCQPAEKRHHTCGMVISFKEALLVLTCRESSLHRESLQKEYVKVVKLQAEIHAHVDRPLETYHVADQP